ncbi:MAG: DUF5714 domain-containing protein [Bacteroidales bacterium]
MWGLSPLSLRRCCKRSSYMAIQKAVEYSRIAGFDKLPYREIKCQWSEHNKMCLAVKCFYFNK